MFDFVHLSLEMLNGMVKSEDPDQTERSELGLHCLYMAFCQKL